MTIASEITRIKTNIENAYTKAEEKGATMPELLNSDSLAGCIESIPKSSGGGGEGIPEIPEGKYRIRFFDIDGDIMSESLISEGDTITYPEPPQYENLEFVEWTTPEYYLNGDTSYEFGHRPISHLDIAPIYKGVDNKQFIYIRVSEDTGYKVIGTLIHQIHSMSEDITQDRTVTIDWGDGNIEEHVFSQEEGVHNLNTVFKELVEHTYNEYGDYIISISDYFKDDYGRVTSSYLNSLSCLLMGDYTDCFWGTRINTYGNNVPDKFVRMIYTNEITNNNLEHCTNHINLERFVAGKGGQISRIIINDYYKFSCFNSIQGMYNNSKIKALIIGSAFNGCSVFGCQELKTIVTKQYAPDIANCNSLKELVFWTYIFDSSLESKKRLILTNNYIGFCKNLKKVYGSSINESYYLQLDDAIIGPSSEDHLYPIFTRLSTNNITQGNVSDAVFLEDVNIKAPTGSYYKTIPYFKNCYMLKNINIEVGDDYNYETLLGFENCYSLKKLDLSNTKITKIENIVNCAIEEIVFPDDITTVYSIRGCDKLKEITIPSSVTNLGSSSYGLFKNNTSLKKVIIEGENTSISYRYAFQGCTNLTELQINENQTQSNTTFYNTFTGCSSLKTYDVPSYITKFEYEDFKGCQSLESINLTPSIIAISYNCFSNCSSLKDINIEDTKITQFNYGTFSNCSALEQIELPNTVTKISTSSSSGYQNFYKCTSLKKVWIPSSVTSISASNYSYSIVFLANPDVIIYTDATEKPSGWGEAWNYVTASAQAKVYWGATKENYENGDLPPEA